jgi:hypothetical protein
MAKATSRSNARGRRPGRAAWGAAGRRTAARHAGPGQYPLLGDKCRECDLPYLFLEPTRDEGPNSDEFVERGRARRCRERGADGRRGSAGGSAISFCGAGPRRTQRMDQHRARRRLSDRRRSFRPRRRGPVHRDRASSVCVGRRLVRVGGECASGSTSTPTSRRSSASRSRRSLAACRCPGTGASLGWRQRTGRVGSARLITRRDSENMVNSSVVRLGGSPGRCRRGHR